MTVSYRFGDVDTHGATLRAWGASLETEHRAVVHGQKLQTAAGKVQWPPSSSAAGLTLAGRPHTRWVKRYEHSAMSQTCREALLDGLVRALTSVNSGN